MRVSSHIWFMIGGHRGSRDTLSHLIVTGKCMYFSRERVLLYFDQFIDFERILTPNDFFYSKKCRNYYEL